MGKFLTNPIVLKIIGGLPILFAVAMSWVHVYVSGVDGLFWSFIKYYLVGSVSVFLIAMLIGFLYTMYAMIKFKVEDNKGQSKE